MRFSSGIHSTLHLGHVKAGLHLVADTPQETTRFWWATTTTVLVARLSECVQQEANVSQALVSLFQPGRKIGRRHKKSVMRPRCRSYIRTHSDPDGNITRRHQVGSKRPSSSDTRNQDGLETSSHVNLGHPTNDDLARCLAAGGGTRVAQRAVICMRCSACDRMGGPRSHRPSRIPTDGERFNERLFVDFCGVVHVRGNRYWWLVAVDQHTDFLVTAPCPSHESQAVAKKMFKH